MKPHARPRPARRLSALALGALVAVTASALLPAPAGAVDAVPETAKTRFIAQADRVCEAGQVRLRGKVDKYESRKQGGSTATRKVATPADVTRFVNEVAAAEIDRQLKELAALKPPSGDASEIRRILAAARTALAELRKNPQNAAFDNPFGAVAKQFSAYGITKCASGDLPASPTGAQ